MPSLKGSPMKISVVVFALAAALLASTSPSPAAPPAPGPFEGEIFYDVVYTSYEPPIHLRYTIKGTQVRFDWVEVDEKDPARTRVLKVKESSFVDWSDPKKGWIEERENNIHLDQLPAPEPYKPLPAKALPAGQREIQSALDYEARYGFALQKAALPAGAAPNLTAPSREIDVDLWQAGDAAALTVTASPLSIVSLKSFPALKDSPFPLVAHAQMKKGAGMAMTDPNHLSYWMYAVSILPKSVNDNVFRQEFKASKTPAPATKALRSMAMPSASLQDAILGNGLFNQVVTVDGPATAK